MLALDAAQIGGELALQLQIVRLAAEMAEQHVFGWDGGVGLQLEAPMAVVPPLVQERPLRRSDAALQFVQAHRVGARERHGFPELQISLHQAALRASAAGALDAAAAALAPERIEPSIVAGRPV